MLLIGNFPVAWHKANMYLSQPSDENLTELMLWFSTEAALSI